MGSQLDLAVPSPEVVLCRGAGWRNLPPISQKICEVHMKASTSLLAVLLMLSSTSLGQAAPAQQAAPGQQAVAGGESSKPEVASQPSTPSTSVTASIPSADADAASAGTVPAVPTVQFGPGAKLFLEPMGGYGELLSEAIVKKKVPVVLVNERAKADFVLSGEAHLKKPGWLGAAVLYPHAKANISIRDVHTGNVVFAYKLDEKQESMSAGELYESSAYACAKHLKKAMEKK
jgi:hypothetical protein